MKAIGHPGPRRIDAADALVLFETSVPEPGPRDILVKLRSVSVNSIDAKLRASGKASLEAPRILGFDGAGIVAAVGSDVTLFKPGDAVAFMGQVDRPGTFAEYSLVDERLAATKPPSIRFEDAAALPLVALTAYELLFERMGIREGEDGHLLIVNGAGGVGSIAIQLARQLTGLKVIATASRPETSAWCRELGAHEVISHQRAPLADELRGIGIAAVDYVASLSGTPERLPDIAACLRPFGTVGVTDQAPALDVMPLRAKSQSLAFEGVFVRSHIRTPDRHLQHEILERIMRLQESGRLHSLRRNAAPRLTTASAIEAHRVLESGRAIGKSAFVVDGIC